MTQQDPQEVSTSDRRSNERKSSEDAVKIQLETTSLEGVASNISGSGILFFTDEELKVTVEVEEADGVKSYTGNLVRCERIKDDRRGWAVEFDRD